MSPLDCIELDLELIFRWMACYVLKKFTFSMYVTDSVARMVIFVSILSSIKLTFILFAKNPEVVVYDRWPF